MRCLHCGREFPAGFFQEWEQTSAARTGRFRCPHCQAEHVRRLIGHHPSGHEEYSVRLWGHPTGYRRRTDLQSP